MGIELIVEGNELYMPFEQFPWFKTPLKLRF
jgi:hypothetical protein